MLSQQRMWLLGRRPSLNRQRFRWTVPAVWEGRRRNFGGGSQSVEIPPTCVHVYVILLYTTLYMSAIPIIH